MITRIGALLVGLSSSRSRWPVSPWGSCAIHSERWSGVLYDLTDRFNTSASQAYLLTPTAVL